MHAFDTIITRTRLSERMPLLFLGHGSPMNAIEENEFVEAFRELANLFPKPEAILCISAHWFTRGTQLTAMPRPRTIHDFYGFPKELYEVQYPASGNPQLAAETQKILAPEEILLDQDWGLDHGTWSVLKHLYPKADVPVIQMSIDRTKPAAFHFDLACKLDVLRDRGILIVGSGNIVHNLGLIDFQNMHVDNYGYDWAHEARQVINDHLMDRNFQALVAYHNQGKALDLAIPTPEHYLPLLYIVGAYRKNEQLHLFNDKLLAGSLSMTSLIIT